MEYLTVHDLVWINQTITGKVTPYDYVSLEAAMAGQYSYGNSRNVPQQAANLLEQLLVKRPFAEGNIRTAFIATLTFLNANGYASRGSDPDAVQIVQAVVRGEKTAQEAIAGLAAPAETLLSGVITLRRLIAYECNHHEEALKALAAED